MRTVVVVMTAALVLVSCGDGESVDRSSPTSIPATTEDVSEFTPESDSPTTASPTTTTTTRATATPMALEVTRDVRYGDDRDGFHPALLDVYAPVEPGPWPLVMMFHGGGGQFQDKSGVDPVASVVASKGAVVVAPNTGGASADPDSRDFRILTDGAASCATWFGLDRAAEFGADPDRLTLTGFSGGANAAALVAITPDASALDTDSCHAPARPVSPDAVVAWEGDYLLAPWWDNTLEANPAFYEEEWIWGRIGASSVDVDWHLVLGPPDRVGNDRLAVDDPFGEGDECDGAMTAGEPSVVAAGGMCRYFELRDPDRTLREAAIRLGLFDDGWLTIGDFTLLLADRLESAGLTTSVTVVDGATHNDLGVEGVVLFADLIVGS